MLQTAGPILLRDLHTGLQLHDRLVFPVRRCRVLQEAVDAGVADLVKLAAGVGVDRDAAPADGLAELGHAYDDVAELAPEFPAPADTARPLPLQYSLS